MDVDIHVVSYRWPVSWRIVWAHVVGTLTNDPPFDCSSHDHLNWFLVTGGFHEDGLG